MKRSLALLVLLALGVLRSFADASLESSFDAANKLYAENRFAEAAAAYEQLARSNAVSPALLFNLGNAQYKAGHVGLAIEAYRRAEKLSPRDADLRANLQFVRSQVQGPTFRPGIIERSVGWLSENEWTGLSAGALWVTFGLLALKQFRPAFAGSLRSWTRLAALTTVLLSIGLAFATRINRPGRLVVVTSREVPVRESLFETSNRAFTANDGAELRVLDRKNDWLQVTDGNTRHFGWLKSTQVVDLP